MPSHGNPCGRADDSCSSVWWSRRTPRPHGAPTEWKQIARLKYVSHMLHMSGIMVKWMRPALSETVIIYGTLSPMAAACITWRLSASEGQGLGYGVYLMVNLHVSARLNMSAKENLNSNCLLGLCKELSDTVKAIYKPSFSCKKRKRSEQQKVRLLGNSPLGIWWSHDYAVVHGRDTRGYVRLLFAMYAIEWSMAGELREAYTHRSS